MKLLIIFLTMILSPYLLSVDIYGDLDLNKEISEEPQPLVTHIGESPAANSDLLVKYYLEDRQNIDRNSKSENSAQNPAFLDESIEEEISCDDKVMPDTLNSQQDNYQQVDKLIIQTFYCPTVNKFTFNNTFIGRQNDDNSPPKKRARLELLSKNTLIYYFVCLAFEEKGAKIIEENKIKILDLYQWIDAAYEKKFPSETSSRRKPQETYLKSIFTKDSRIATGSTVSFKEGWRERVNNTISALRRTAYSKPAE